MIYLDVKLSTVRFVHVADWKILTITFLLVLNILQREMIFLMKYFGLKTCNIVNTHVLLWGDSSISNTDNKHLFNLVQKYIKDSERF